MGNLLTFIKPLTADQLPLLSSSRSRISLAQPLAGSLPLIFNIPLDVWFEIMDHLPLHAKVALSLTCKHALRLVGLSAARQLRSKPEEIQSFLMILERELPGMAVLCFECNTYHCRDPNFLSRMFRKPCKVLQRHRAFAGLPKLNGATIFRVMKQQRLGPAFGLPLGFLTMCGFVGGHCRNHENGVPYDYHKWLWSARSMARAIDGQLILRVEYRLRFNSSHYDDFVRGERLSHRVIESAVCGHRLCDYARLATALNSFVARRHQTIGQAEHGVEKKGGNCGWCSSEYFYMFTRKSLAGSREERSTIGGSGRIFILIRYTNLGPGYPVIAEAIKVLRAIEKARPDTTFNIREELLGGCSIDAHGTPLTDEALNAAKNADAVLLGAIGGPKWGTGQVRPEQGILRLRKELQTYGNLRPCFFASPSLVSTSPLKESVCKDVNFTVVRELTGGLYFGDRKEDTGDGTAYDVEPYSRPEIERIVRLSAYLALQESPPAKVWSLDKANVLATSRLWRRVVDDVMTKEFPQLEYGHHLIDSAAMLMVKNPRALNGIIVTSNLFGDIISDEASVIPGSLGLLPSASLGAIPDGKTKVNGVYEPIHGSAPDISGKGIVNPVAMLLSVSMMFKYSLCEPELALAVDQAVKQVIEKGIRTADIGGTSTTAEVGDAVASELVQILSGKST
ncbi:3-isopropylmalate dehydrogenase [Verruconis gallopava]|uniref:3-isopropylmalate dehydrogenase n=1 Tax=Verruconis gallopava TaxID=253628 RepID=A0A0D1YWI9_9PEZI|nr:3-isopropylmalate dehydrogenase [Verruconis gallopava]KIW05017.1 3-isopropylmalate dehydrogenase [Verruconis gallopava]